jgi:hypothetical protein
VAGASRDDPAPVLVRVTGEGNRMLFRFGFQEHAVGCIKQGWILNMTSISLCDFEVHNAFVSPQHFESNHFFVKLLHRVQVLDANRHFSEAFDTVL